MIFIYKCWVVWPFFLFSSSFFSLADMLWHMCRGRNQGRLWLVKLTVGCGAAEERELRGFFFFFFLSFLLCDNRATVCQRDHSKYEGMTSHKATLIKGVSFCPSLFPNALLSPTRLPVLPGWLNDRRHCWTAAYGESPERERESRESKRERNWTRPPESKMAALIFNSHYEAEKVQHLKIISP